MNIREAIDVLNTLLTGTDPETGEILPEEHILHNPQIKDALRTSLRVISAIRLQPADSSLPLTRSVRLNAGRPWTKEDRDALRHLYASGISIDEIARLTHRRARGVRLQLNLMAGGGARRDERTPIADPVDGEPPIASKRGQRWTQADDDALARQFRAGQSLRELAAAFGRSQFSIRKRLEKLCLIIPEDDPDSPTRPWTDEDVSQLRHMYESGLPIGHISAVMNRTTAAVSARLFYMGLGGSAPEIIPPDVAKPMKAEPEQPVQPPSAHAASITNAAAISPSRPWTAEDDAYLLRAWAEGVSLGDICASLNRRDRLVRCRLIYLGAADHSLIGMPSMPPELAHQGLPWYPEEIDRLYHMFRHGRAPEQMAAELLRSVGAIRSRLEMLGLTTD